MGGVTLYTLRDQMGSVSLDNAEQLIADVKAAGFKYFIIPVPPMGYFEFDRENRSISISTDVEGMANLLTALAEKCKAGGVEMRYHNHNFEFEENEKSGDGILHRRAGSNLRWHGAPGGHPDQPRRAEEIWL